MELRILLADLFGSIIQRLPYTFTRQRASSASEPTGAHLFAWRAESSRSFDVLTGLKVK